VIADANFRECLTVVAWHALGLLSDIEARKSKILLLGLCRTPSNDPRTYYTLKDVCVVPLADIKRIFKNLPQKPSRMLKDNEQERQMSGAIGSMLVMSLEQTADDSRPVLEALGKVGLSLVLPLQGSSFHVDIDDDVPATRGI
jgi:hypothetical protein